MDKTFTAKSAIRELTSLSKPGKAADLQQFFKTAPGEYGEGDVFLGVMVPQTRQIAGEYSNMALIEIEKLTSSEFHEARLCGLLILTQQYKRAKDSNTKKSIFGIFGSLLLLLQLVLLLCSPSIGPTKNVQFILMKIKKMY